MACRGDVRTSEGGVVVGGMMRLVAWWVTFLTSVQLGVKLTEN